MATHFDDPQAEDRATMMNLARAVGMMTALAVVLIFVAQAAGGGMV